MGEWKDYVWIGDIMHAPLTVLSYEISVCLEELNKITKKSGLRAKRKAHSKLGQAACHSD
jgi:hypothetical protein